MELLNKFSSQLIFKHEITFFATCLNQIKLLNTINSCNKYFINKKPIKTDFNYFLIFLTFFFIGNVKCSGLFELDIIRYEYYDSSLINYNHQNLSQSNFWNRLTNYTITNQINTNLIYNVCLKESKARFLTKPCTFGELQASANLFNPYISLKEKFTYRWPKSITLIISIMKIDDQTSELKTIDKHIHFNSNLVPVVYSNFLNESWIYKLSLLKNSRLLYRFRITCSKNYFGDDCSKFCRERNDLYGHYKCDREGKINCLPGWKGEQCDKPICSKNCSSHHGYCKMPGECLCKQGYKGFNCDKCIPHQNCFHGFCKNPYECICESNWGGTFCDQNLNYCATHSPCLNEGICNNNGSDQYHCLCKPGYSGKNCEDISNICLTNPCLNGGKCIPNNFSKTEYNCLCPENKAGKNCEINFNYCNLTKSPCGLNGRCLNSKDGYQCLCDPGYIGLKCEKLNKKIILTRLEENKIFEMKKMLKEKFSSNLTLIAQTDKQVCQNNGQLVVTYTNEYRCVCEPGWTGDNCENSFHSYEINNPCLNQAELVILGDDYKCICKKGFQGKNCGTLNENVCDIENFSDENLISSSNVNSISTDFKNDNLDKYWQVETDLKNSNESCEVQWCTCSNEETDYKSINDNLDKILKKKLVCVCIKEEEFDKLNTRQLEKLNLAINPFVDQLMLVDNQDFSQQQYLLEQLPIKLHSQMLKTKSELGSKEDELNSVGLMKTKNLNFKQNISKANENIKEMINEVLINTNQDESDDLFVSLTLIFQEELSNNQTQVICSSMLAIFSLICNQPNLDQINFACKQKGSSSIRFYTLDNDERVLNVGDVIKNSITSLHLSTIIKRAYRLNNSNEKIEFEKWKTHCLIVLSVCVVFWLFVIITMIFILISSNNNLLKKKIIDNKLLGFVSLNLNNHFSKRSKIFFETSNKQGNKIKEENFIYNNLNDSNTKNCNQRFENLKTNLHNQEEKNNLIDKFTLKKLNYFYAKSSKCNDLVEYNLNKNNSERLNSYIYRTQLLNENLFNKNESFNKGENCISNEKSQKIDLEKDAKFEIDEINCHNELNNENLTKNLSKKNVSYQNLDDSINKNIDYEIDYIDDFDNKFNKNYSIDEISVKNNFNKNESKLFVNLDSQNSSNLIDNLKINENFIQLNNLKKNNEKRKPIEPVCL